MPHVCGDEPTLEQQIETIEAVCPTYVGMNRMERLDTNLVEGMPHVCGDEPNQLKVGFWLICMPHVCGDEPPAELVARGDAKYAPRMWG